MCRLPGGQAGGGDWLGPLLALAARHADAGEEVFLAPAARAQPRGDRHAVSETRFLWADVDRADGLPALGLPPVVRHAEATAGVSLTANEAHMLANVLNSTARRTEATG